MRWAGEGCGWLGWGAGFSVGKLAQVARAVVPPGQAMHVPMLLMLHLLRPSAPSAAAPSAECKEALAEFVARAPADAEDVQKVKALLKSLEPRGSGGGGE